MAGGEGRRLNPYSKVLPKPLWPVGDYPIVEILIKQLAKSGIKDIIMAVGQQAKLIQMIIGDGKQYGVKVNYSIEKKPLGTVGPLKKIKSLDNDFLVLNGDILTDLSFKQFIKSHLTNNSPATIAAFRRSMKIDFGVISSRKDQITEYQEKPTLKYIVSSGIYAFNRSIIDLIPRGAFSFPELVNRLIELNRNPNIYKFKGYWLDIGRPEDWEKADRLFSKKKNVFLK